MTGDSGRDVAFEEWLVDDRYARQRLIEWWDQERLARSKVLVAGAGALGNEVLKNLALVGVGKILVVDFDRVEASNLSRCVLFSAEDLGKPKAAAAAAAVRRINAEVAVDGLFGDLELDLGLGELGEYDVVLGCLDSVNARWSLNRACQRAGVPWINAGIGAAAGEIALFKPEVGSCYECGMTDGMWQRFNERYSCMLMLKSLPERAVPATAVIAGLTASLQVNEVLALLHGRSDSLQPGQKLFVSVKPYSVFVVDIPKDAGCTAHEAYGPRLRMNCAPQESTCLELLDAVPESEAIQLDFDLLTGFSCPACGETRHCQPMKKAAQQNLTCPKCGQQRKPLSTHEVHRNSWFAGLPLSGIGIPSRAVLKVRTRSGGKYIELGKPRRAMEEVCQIESR